MSEPKLLKTQNEIFEKVAELGAILTHRFQGKEPVAICVLNSSFMFYSDLIRQIDLDLTCEFLGVSSYKESQVSSGAVKVTLDLDISLEGKDVILIEDLIDSGLTMNYLIENFKSRKPNSLMTVALLQKTECLKVPCKVDLVGFEVGPEFIVGYGIDSAGAFRNLPYLATV